jgi:hypothetical protein
MSHKRLQQGTAPPSFCFWCNAQLMRAPGKGKGLFYFGQIIDKDGSVRRVHGDCVRLAINDGYKEATS